MTPTDASADPRPAGGAAGVALEQLIADGRALLEQEREKLLAGQIRGVAALAADKQRLATLLEERLPRAVPTPALRRALEGLIAQARENERLLMAARHGVAEAERHLRAIVATARGAVAYDRDGSAILGPDGSGRKASRA